MTKDKSVSEGIISVDTIFWTFVAIFLIISAAVLSLVAKVSSTIPCIELSGIVLIWAYVLSIFVMLISVIMLFKHDKNLGMFMIALMLMGFVHCVVVAYNRGA